MHSGPSLQVVPVVTTRTDVKSGQVTWAGAHLRAIRVSCRLSSAAYSLVEIPDLRWQPEARTRPRAAPAVRALWTMPARAAHEMTHDAGPTGNTCRSHRAAYDVQRTGCDECGTSDVREH